MKSISQCFSINHRTLFLLVLSVFLFMNAVPGHAEGYPRVMFIFDASGSMWGQMAGQTKIEIARDVMSRIVPELPPEVHVGLTAYGHRRKGDCQDIEMIISPDSTDRAQLLRKVNSLNPMGKTPIADSIQLVADQLKSFEEETTIVLISDGKETCHDDPCGVVRNLKSSGIKFILHVVGFGVNNEESTSLKCLPEAGGGRYFPASDSTALFDALNEVKTEVTQKVELAKTTTKKVKTGLGKLQITLPESSLRCVNKIKIVRTSDDKVVKTIDSVKSDSTHPLMSGEYEIIAGYANSNYKPDSDTSLGTYEIPGGETVVLAMGALAVNIADSLADIPAGAVVITRTDPTGFELVTPYTGNSYYFFKTKPLPPGTYSFGVHYRKGDLYRTPEDVVTLADEILIEPGEESVATINAGIQVEKPGDAVLESWYLTEPGKTEPTIMIKSASNGDYPLWKPYAVAAGNYDFYALVEGMTEALPVGQDMTISSGDLLSFNTGL